MKLATLCLVTFLTSASAFAESDSTNSIDCSIAATGGSFDRIVLTANDDTGAVAYQAYKNGKKSEARNLDSDSYMIFNQNDLKKDPQQAAMIMEIAKRINARTSPSTLFVRFNVSKDNSGDNFFALKFVTDGKSTVAALTILGTTLPCK